MALVTRLSLIVLDEPTSALDLLTQAIIYAGQIVEVGHTRDFFPASLHPSAQMSMVSVPRLQGESDPMFNVGQPPSLMDLPAGCRLRHDRCDQDPPVFTRDGCRVKCWLYE